MNNSIADIKKEFEQTIPQERKRLYKKYAEDSRVGVRSLIARYQKQEEQLLAEHARLDAMWEYERKYKNCTYICGIDEAGRGPLAGPVVAGAVI